MADLVGGHFIPECNQDPLKVTATVPVRQHRHLPATASALRISEHRREDDTYLPVIHHAIPLVYTGKVDLSSKANGRRPIRVFLSAGDKERDYPVL